MFVETKCVKCGSIINLDVGEMTKEEAMTMIKKMDNQPRECPGYHTELGGWIYYWNLEEAINNAYDNNNFKQIEIQSDYDFVKELLDKGCEVIDGGSNKVPELNLKSIHDHKGLIHLGFGDFADNDNTFLRKDSPIGTRYYLKSSNA